MFNTGKQVHYLLCINLSQIKLINPRFLRCPLDGHLLGSERYRRAASLLADERVAPSGEAARAEKSVDKPRQERQPAAGDLMINRHLVLKSGRGRYEREKVMQLEAVSFGLKTSHLPRPGPMWLLVYCQCLANIDTTLNGLHKGVQYNSHFLFLYITKSVFTAETLNWLLLQLKSHLPFNVNVFITLHDRNGDTLSHSVLRFQCWTRARQI